MAETKTVNYQWTKPEVTKSPSTWGQTLNDDLDGIDGQIKANEVNVAAIQGYLTPQGLIISRTASSGAYINYQNGAAPAGQQIRWQIVEEAGAEGGNNGSRLITYAFSDTGANLGWTMLQERVTQTVIVAKDPTNALGVATKQYVDRGAAPIGTIIMWGGPSASIPPGWVQCWGQKYNYTQYPALFNVIGGNYGWDGANFSVPNFSQHMPIGWDNTTAGQGGYYLGLMGGEYTHQISVAELPGHTHPITDVVHNHNAFQNAHNHTIVTGNHAHGIVTGSHSHTYERWTNSGGSNVYAQLTYTQGTVTTNTSTAGNLGGNTDTAGNLGGYTDNQTPAIGVIDSGTNLSTTQQAGGWAAHNNMPPYTVVLFLIRIV